MVDRACVTSVMRTYYSFQAPKSSDRSYNWQLVGLWSWAELAIGIIVGCLPFTPKFVQHVGPKTLNILKIVFRPKVSPAHKQMTTTDKIPKENSMATYERPFAKYNVGSSIANSVTDPYVPQTRLHGDCLPLTANGSDSSRSMMIIVHEQTHSLGVKIAPGSESDDQEYGQNRV